MTKRQYGAIVYGKAALFFNAIYDAIGDEKFNQLLQDYFTAVSLRRGLSAGFSEGGGEGMWARRSWMSC